MWKPHIRHGTALKLRNMKWLGSRQGTSENILGSLILEVLDLALVTFLRLLQTASLDAWMQKCHWELLSIGRCTV